VRAPNAFGASFANFVPDPSVTDKLEVVNNISLKHGSDGRYRWIFYGIDFNPDAYRLTTKDGLTYSSDQFAGLQQIADRNGNAVTFTDTLPSRTPAVARSPWSATGRTASPPSACRTVRSPCATGTTRRATSSR
jgi:hypothetical protein